MIFPLIYFWQRSSFQWGRQSSKYGHGHPAPLNQINFLINVINDMIYVMDLLHLGECDKVPDFCRGKGLCLNTHNPRLTHCQCERGSFGRHCEFNGTNSWTVIFLEWMVMSIMYKFCLHGRWIHVYIVWHEGVKNFVVPWKSLNKASRYCIYNFTL